MRLRRVIVAVVVMVASVAVTGAWQLTVTAPRPASATPLTPGLTSLAGRHGEARSRVDGTGENARFREMVDVDVDPAGQYLYVLELGSSDGAIPDAVRRVNIATQAVLTYSTSSSIQSDPAHLEVDPDGIPWVAANSPTTANTKALIKTAGSVATVMLDGLHGFYDGGRAGDGFYIDPVDDYVYYSSGNAPGRPEHEPWLWRIPLNSLPANATQGTALASMGDQYGGPVNDMEMGSDGRLYVVYEGNRLLRYDGSTMTLMGAAAGWNSSTRRRIGFVPGSGSLLNLCVGCHTIERRPSFGSQPVAVRTDVAGLNGTYGTADGDPGRLNQPVGLAVSPDGTKAWIADRGSNRVRELVLPPDPNRLSEEELCGSCNPGERRLVPPKVLDPVDVASGSLTESFTDLAVPVRGKPLAVTRTYNSLLNDRTGLFGPGWSSPLDMTLTQYTGAVIVHQENGADLPFSRLAGGTIVAPPRVTSTLTAVTDGWQLVRNGNETTTFDTQGRVTSFKDSAGTKHGHTITVTYPSATQIVMSSSGRTLTFNRNTSGRVTSVSDNSVPARTVTYTYTSGKLTGVTSFKVNDDDAAPVTWGYAYNPTSGLLQAVTNPRGHSNFTHYDAQGRVDYQLDYAGQRSDIVYGPDAPVTWREVTTPAYNAAGTRSTTRYELENLLVTSVTTGYGTPDARTTDFEYDGERMSVNRVVGEGNVQLARYEYDVHGNVTKAVDVAGRQTIYEDFDTYNQPGKITDNAGTETINTYTAGFLTQTSTQIKSPSGTLEGHAITTYVRGDAAHPEDVTSIVTPDLQGRTPAVSWKFNYRPSDGLLNWEENPEGDRTTYAYDSRGFVQSVVSPRGYETLTVPDDYRTTFDVNDFGMVQSVTDPLDKVSLQRFDGNGNVILTRDANLNESSTAFDQMNRPTLVQRADGSELETTYFPNGALREQINGLGEPTSYTYDAHGAMTSMVDPLGNATGYGYDELGRLKTRTDPGGNCPAANCVTYGYNAGSELNSIIYTDPATPDVTTFTYDSLGRRLSMGQAGRPASSWTWDSLGRMRSSTDINGRTVSYGYFPSGLLKQIFYPGQATPVSYTYDDAGRMETVTDWSSRVTSFDHDADGNWTDTTFPSASTNTDARVYDEAGRLASVTWRKGSTVLGSLSYDRDDKGLLESETPTGVTGFSTQDWGYDPVDQLDEVNAATLDYDDAGNLTRTEDGRLQVYDPAQRLCWSSPTASTGTCASPATDATVYSYDARGNRTASETPTGDVSTFAYDQDNRMTGARLPAASDSGGTFVSIAPSRVADTRGAGTGVCNGGTCTRLAAGASMTVQITGRGNVPASGVAAVAGTVTIAAPAANGYSRVNPGGTGAAATINYNASANQGAYIIAPVDSQGRITIYTSAAADVVVDITGYYLQPGSSGAGFEALPPARLVDTRSPNNVGLCPTTACTTPVAGTTTQVQASGRAGLPSSGATAAIVSLSIVGPATSGYARINPSGGSGTATINYEAGKNINEVAIVPLDAQGRLSVFVSTSVNFVLDVTGYLTNGDGGHLRSIDPHRTIDTRVSAGTCSPSPCSPLAANGRTTVTATGIPAGADAIVAWVTVATPTGTGHLRVAPNAPTGTGTSGAATIDFQSGVSADSLVIVPLTPSGTFDIAATAATNVVIDITGFITTHDSWTYTYDATGLRTKKQHNVEASYQFTWNRAAGLPLLLSQHVGTATNYLIYGPAGTPIYQITSTGAVRYFHQDQQGSTRLVTDVLGAVYGTIEYDAYGRKQASTIPETADQPLAGYATQYVDTETGLIYLRARYHDPTTGQFVSRDPLVMSTRDPFGYALSNPVNGSDPSGLCGFLGDGPCTPGGFVDDVDDAVGEIKDELGVCGIRDEEGCTTYAESNPRQTQAAVNFAGGVLDTNPITGWLPLDLEGHGVQKSGGWYQGGRWSMIGVSLLAGGASGGAGAFNAVFSGLNAATVCTGLKASVSHKESCAAALMSLVFAGMGPAFGKLIMPDNNVARICSAGSAIMSGL